MELASFGTASEVNKIFFKWKIIGAFFSLLVSFVGFANFFIPALANSITDL